MSRDAWRFVATIVGLGMAIAFIGSGIALIASAVMP